MDRCVRYSGWDLMTQNFVAMKRVIAMFSSGVGKSFNVLFGFIHVLQSICDRIERVTSVFGGRTRRV